MKIRLLFLILTLFLYGIALNAQYYDTGQDPASLRWLQIKTGNYTVIYPEKYGREGIEFARSLDKANTAIATLFPVKKFRLPVVIHNFTVESNGYVAWAPKRMELLPTPEQNTIPLDPKSQLTLHELAHVYQMEALNDGTIRILSYFFGQQITGLSAAMLPAWFMEGDAVFSETVLSESGRGRSPDFEKKLKAITIEKGGIYKYDKLTCGSFRDYTPDHYQFGYQMVAWSLASADLNLWNRTMKFVANEPFTINPVNISLRMNTGLTKRLLYNQTFDVLKNQWQKDISELGAKKYPAINPDKKDRYINYYSPIFTGRDSIIAIKTSLTGTPAFVLLDTSIETEKRIHIPGNIYPYIFSFAKGKIVWVETVVDPRWINREYSIIKVKDIRTGKVLQLTRKTRYLAASISPDGKTIAAAENTADNKNSLVLLETRSGNLIKSIPVPGNDAIQQPCWSDDGKTISSISLSKNGEGILSYTLQDNSWKTLLDAGRNDLQSARLRNDSLFFTSSASGVENGFIKTPEGKIIEITNSRFGANDLSISGSSILFSDYSSDGNDICISSIPRKETVEFSNNAKSSMLAERFDIRPAGGNENEKEFKPEPYRKWQHLFNFHSWMPFYYDISAVQSEPVGLRPGFTIMSQNVLSTLTATAGYEYSAEKKHMLHTDITWAGWYAVLQSRLDYGSDPLILKGTNDPIPSSVMPGYHFANTLYLPLNFTNSRFSQFLYLAVSSDYRKNYIFISKSGDYDAGQEQLGGRIYFYNYTRSALRDIYPRWAQILDFGYFDYPFDKSVLGSDIYLKTALYFPGILRNTSLKVRFESEQQHSVKYINSNRISFPRGYSNIVAIKLNFISAEYYAPLLYPDLSISSVLYIPRIRGSVFYDHANGKLNTNQSSAESFDSFGGQLLADFNLFRIPYRISAGVQASWKSPGATPVFEMVFNMDINGTVIGRKPRL
jgi:hypothetical protein